MEYRKNLIDFHGGVKQTFAYLKKTVRSIDKMLSDWNIEEKEHSLRTNALKKFKRDLQTFIDNNLNND